MPQPLKQESLGYRRLEQQLSLLAWLNNQLGYPSTASLLEDIKTSEDADGDGRLSASCCRILGNSHRLIPNDKLVEYDTNIHRHLGQINAGNHRGEPITLRYFQYLATLVTEIYLDRWFAGPEKLRDDLNFFIKAEQEKGRPEAANWTAYETTNLSKLAFWMATGSGKTLLMHLNYYQFQHYRQQYRPDEAPLKNILLITPNEGLSQQHLDELKLSNINGATPFDLLSSNQFANGGTPLHTIEITKLVTKKKGEGASVPLDVFEPENLIFVDEGHKGSGGDAWKNTRDALGKTGFTFEYSATFGQALAAAKNPNLVAEYGKSIAFDYSYRYFYNDGYGKEFRILNLSQETTQETTNILLLANLLSFYQQQKFYADHAQRLTEYNLERPLAVFVGQSVNAVYTESKQRRSDVLTVCQFLNRLLTEPTWAMTNIAQIMQGNSGFRHPETGQDLFAQQFNWLAGQFQDPSTLYQSILRETLNVDDPEYPGELIVREIQRSKGELGLTTGATNPYFGVINIGDAKEFRQLVQRTTPAITCDDDFITESLFTSVNQVDTPINLLIGAKKFIEGWNSWRVSNMGLLNMGQTEGSQIIQMFGRGVRLKGQAMSLKRSTFDPKPDRTPHPDNLPLLETLNIFALRANYMARFREYLENEGITEAIPLKIPVRSNAEFFNKHLVIPRLEANTQFEDTQVVILQHSPSIVGSPILVNLATTVGIIQSVNPDNRLATAGQQVSIPPENLELVDWTKVYLNLLEYKARKRYHSLVIPQPKVLRHILAAHRPPKQLVYQLIANPQVINPTDYATWQQLQDSVVAILKQYADTLYRQSRTEWANQRLVYKPLDEAEPNLTFNKGDSETGHYHIRLSGEHQRDLAQQIKNLLEDCNSLYHQDGDAPLPRIHFDQHLYQPLLLAPEKGITLSPEGLNKSEHAFVRDLQRFWENKRDKLPEDTEVFLLRNQSRGRGVGFYETRQFFPDFILWVKTATKQRIIFVEPHGMRHELPYHNNEKATLYARLPQLANEIAQRSNTKVPVELDAFIISATQYNELSKTFDDGSWNRKRFTQNHILFLEPDNDYDYLEIIFQVAKNTE